MGGRARGDGKGWRQVSGLFPLMNHGVCRVAWKALRRVHGRLVSREFDVGLGAVGKAMLGAVRFGIDALEWGTVIGP